MAATIVHFTLAKEETLVSFPLFVRPIHLDMTTATVASTGLGLYCLLVHRDRADDVLTGSALRRRPPADDLSDGFRWRERTPPCCQAPAHGQAVETTQPDTPL
jgi:hypothetical protein